MVLLGRSLYGLDLVITRTFCCLCSRGAILVKSLRTTILGQTQLFQLFFRSIKRLKKNYFQWIGHSQGYIFNPSFYPYWFWLHRLPSHLVFKPPMFTWPIAPVSESLLAEPGVCNSFQIKYHHGPMLLNINVTTRTCHRKIIKMKSILCCKLAEIDLLIIYIIELKQSANPSLRVRIQMIVAQFQTSFSFTSGPSCAMASSRSLVTRATPSSRCSSASMTSKTGKKLPS